MTATEAGDRLHWVLHDKAWTGVCRERMGMTTPCDLERAIAAIEDEATATLRAALDGGDALADEMTAHGDPLAAEFGDALRAALDDQYRETPPCPFCGHREHRDDICEQDLGEHGECQCADARPRSDGDIVRAAYDRLDAVNIEQARTIATLRAERDEAQMEYGDACMTMDDQRADIARLNETLNSEIAECVRLRAALHGLVEDHRPLVRNGPFIECSCGWQYDEGDGDEWVLHLRAALATAKETP